MWPNYKKLFLAWGELADLLKSKLVIAVALSLTEDETHIPERVFVQIILEDGLIINLDFWTNIVEWMCVMIV